MALRTAGVKAIVGRGVPAAEFGRSHERGSHARSRSFDGERENPDGIEQASQPFPMGRNVQSRSNQHGHAGGRGVRREFINQVMPKNGLNIF